MKCPYCGTMNELDAFRCKNEDCLEILPPIDGEERTLAYREVISELIKFLCEFIKFDKESKMIKLMDELGYDKNPYYDELGYLHFFAIFTAVRKKFPDYFEKIIEDLRKAIFDLFDTHLQDLRVKLKSELKLNQRILGYMQTWNETSERSKRINDSSLLNNFTFTIGKKAAINAYGEEKGMDVRIVMALGYDVMGLIMAYDALLKNVNVEL